MGKVRMSWWLDLILMVFSDPNDSMIWISLVMESQHNFPLGSFASHCLQQMGLNKGITESPLL